MPMMNDIWMMKIQYRLPVNPYAITPASSARRSHGLPCLMRAKGNEWSLTSGLGGTFRVGAAVPAAAVDTAMGVTSGR